MILAQRQSNIEAMRILAMCMIIGLHYNGGVSSPLPKLGVSDVVYHLTESCCIFGVNLFVLITGYFSIRSNQIKLGKICKLLFEVVFWGTVGYILSLILKWNHIDFKEYIKIIVPYLWGGRWFVKAYIILLLFIPFINKCLHAISKRTYQVLLLIFFLLFCLWPSFLPSPPIDDFGYGFVHFIFLYLLAAYIRLYQKMLPRGYALMVFIMCVLVLTLASLYLPGPWWAYNHFFVVIGALSLFVFFLQLKIRQSSIINTLAACAFGVFLIHTDGFFAELIYHRVFHINEVMQSGIVWRMLLNFILCVSFFYLFGFCLEYLRKMLFEKAIDRMLSKILGRKEHIIIE